jgi:hypothetical protein
MRLASLLLLLVLPQAEAHVDEYGTCSIVVESTCSKESKTCKALFKKEDLPKGKECSTPQKGLKWVVPESVPKECQKEAAALAERANRGNLKELCELDGIATQM